MVVHGFRHTSRVVNRHVDATEVNTFERRIGPFAITIEEMFGDSIGRLESHTPARYRKLLFVSRGIHPTLHAWVVEPLYQWLWDEVGRQHELESEADASGD